MKYRVHLCETIGDYAQEEWHEDYNTLDEAKRRIISVNVAGHFAGSTEWYVQAKEEIETIE